MQTRLHLLIFSEEQNWKQCLFSKTQLIINFIHVYPNAFTNHEDNPPHNFPLVFPLKLNSAICFSLFSTFSFFYLPPSFGYIVSQLFLIYISLGYKQMRRGYDPVSHCVFTIEWSNELFPVIVHLPQLTTNTLSPPPPTYTRILLSMTGHKNNHQKMFPFFPTVPKHMGAKLYCC